MSKKGYEVSGRNVFNDIGVPNADEHLVKAQLVYKIDTIMKKRRMKQTEAAALFGAWACSGTRSSSVTSRTTRAGFPTTTV